VVTSSWFDKLSFTSRPVTDEATFFFRDTRMSDDQRSNPTNGGKGSKPKTMLQAVQALVPQTITGHGEHRNPGTGLKPEWFEGIQVNLSAVERRAATIGPRRSVKKEFQAAWLVKAITCIDLTTLAGDDTPGRVHRLAMKARRPLRDDLVDALGLGDTPPTVGAVCVYPTMVATAVKALRGSGIPVASVATGFPAGLTPLPQRLAEIRYAVEEGAGEIDIVITRAHVLLGEWQALYDEVAAMREACGDAHLKTILGTGDLKTLRNVYKASMVAMQAGADFIKTSTGKEDVNATLPVSLTMIRALRDYGDLTGEKVGFKPAGGLRTAKDALLWLTLMKEELGLPWLQPDLFRIGASSMLGDIERQIEHFATGRYAAAAHHALA
jgi:deoxyribose-phosphate aldolase